MSKNEHDCYICLEIISSRARNNGCGHEFCFDCITTWSTNTNRCPVCKAEFTEITKVDYVPARGVPKTRKAATYKVLPKKLVAHYDAEELERRALSESESDSSSDSYDDSFSSCSSSSSSSSSSETESSSTSSSSSESSGTRSCSSGSDSTDGDFSESSESSIEILWHSSRRPLIAQREARNSTMAKRKVDDDDSIEILPKRTKRK